VEFLWGAKCDVDPEKRKEEPSCVEWCVHGIFLEFLLHSISAKAIPNRCTVQEHTRLIDGLDERTNIAIHHNNLHLA
jgi:hypothetical protein